MKLGLSRFFELQPDPYDITQRKSIRICVFRNVKNAIKLCEMLSKCEIDVAMIKAELLIEPFVLLAAANCAIHQAAHNRLCTRSLSAELIFSLSPTRNISESLSVFGITESCKNLVVAIFDDANGKKMINIAKKIDGTPAPLETLREITDIPMIKKVYQVTEPELNASTISDLIVTRIVCKDLV